MRSTLPLVWSMICCQLIGFATPFQHHRLLSPPSTVFRISIRDPNPKYHRHRSQTCLFERRRDRHDAMWDASYQELAKFYKENGHLVVERNNFLYQWMIRQRSRRRGKNGVGPMSEERIKLLDELGFDWEPRAGPETMQDKRWNQKYQVLAEFYNKHGHVDVASTDSLYRWMETQRKRRRGLERFKPLNDEQIQLLDKVGFDWDRKVGRPEGSSGPRHERWMMKYQELAEYYSTHGHLKKVESKSLYLWVLTQRRRRRKVAGSGSLTEEQIQLLDAIKFPWTTQRGRPGGERDSGWTANYKELANFYKQNGHLEVEQRSSLYLWCATQRKKRRAAGNYSPLSEEQIRLMDKIGFEWSPKQGRPNGSHQEIWMERYQELAEFYKSNGHFKVAPMGSLYIWMLAQRRRRKGAKGYSEMTSEQIRLLDEINFPWKPKCGPKPKKKVA